MIHLWKKYKDAITGFVGIATSRTVFLTWCDRIQLTPEVKEWDVKDSYSFDVTTLELVDEGCYEFFNKKPEPVEEAPKRGWPALFNSKPAY